MCSQIGKAVVEVHEVEDDGSFEVYHGLNTHDLIIHVLCLDGECVLFKAIAIDRDTVRIWPHAQRPGYRVVAIG